MSVVIKVGDVRTRLAEVAEKSIRCCVTSPPYFGLRDYGHSGQIGLEPTPDAYVAELVSVFREVKRVLRDDGTLWLNLGDSYAANQSNNGGCSPKSTLGGGGGRYRVGSKNEAAYNSAKPRTMLHGLKPKDLIGIPWRVAFALQSDGWWLRSDIIWHKPNPMPESVTDRPTKAHEYVFLLSKSERYYYDAAAIGEAFADDRMGNPNGGGHYAREAFAYAGPSAQSGLQKGEWNTDGAKTWRNKRSVWTVATQPFSEAHFATFPPALIEPCIKAGSAKGDTVLDPFGGAGTTGLVADRLGRNALLCELNPDYAAMAEQRIGGDNPMFSKVTLDSRCPQG